MPQLRANFMGTEFWFYDKGVDRSAQYAAGLR